MANNYFDFKKFRINQENCAMKVGTDGVLLGAWGSVGNSEQTKILDIGSGTGIVSLIAAQRNENAIIDAVEIDEKASFQCKSNFENSPWAERLTVHNFSLQEFAELTNKKYDYIFSNPPYFNNSLKNPDLAKSTARHTDILPYEDLAKCVAKLLKNKGVFSAIFPYIESGIFTAIAVKWGLYVNKRLEVRGNPNKAVKRVLLEFSTQRITNIESSEMSIELYERHQYSPEYIELTKDFYLKM